MHLRAVAFDWKDGGGHDFGFIAEEVAAVNNLLATYNKDGQIQGVKYDQLTAILTNAIKEQQGKIDGINTQLANYGLRVDDLAAELKNLAERVDTIEAEVEKLKEFNNKQLEINQELQDKIRRLESR
jgi:chromosome segregation ATPase